jgi:hypothetical protein
MAEKYVYGPFDHGATRDFSRAHLEFYGINHFRPTFTARIYFNDTKVTPKNADEKRQSYAGKFAMLGHETCYGDEGHCDVPETPPRRFDDRPSHPLTPAYRRVVVTNALKRAIRKGKKLTVTVIVDSQRPFKPPADKKHDHAERLFEIKGMQLVTYA